MGMFDSIRFEEISMLPKPEGFDLDTGDLDFQTKSLDNALYLYEISKDKYLYREDGPLRVDDVKESRRQRMDFHGVINFGAYKTTDLVDYSLEYEAKFTDGVLQDVKLLSYKTYDHESRKKQTESLLERQRTEDKKILNRIQRFLNKVIFSPIFNFFGLPNARLHFSCPNLVLFYKPTDREKNYGLYFDEISTGVCLKKTKYSTVFSCKLLGFGFVYHNFKTIDFVYD